jgi:hypothetical protein
MDRRIGFHDDWNSDRKRDAFAQFITCKAEYAHESGPNGEDLGNCIPGISERI